MRMILFIGAGSFIGGIGRYLLSRLVQLKSTSAFPYGTLAVNLIGCFFMGVVFTLFTRDGMSEEWKLFLSTGILGGFTTFSAFSSETVLMMREEQFGYAFLYVAVSITLGLLFTYGGMIFTKSFA